MKTLVCEYPPFRGHANVPVIGNAHLNWKLV